MKIKTPKARSEARRSELIAVLRESIPSYRDKSPTQLLAVCNLTEEALALDCAWPGVPWLVAGLHYYTLGLRAVRARAAGRFPDGSQFGSDNPSATTPSYATIITSKQPEDIQ